MSWHLVKGKILPKVLLITDYKVFITVLFISSSVIVTRLDDLPHQNAGFWYPRRKTR